MSDPFLRNDILSFKGGRYRVIAVLPEVLSLFDLTKAKAWPYWETREAVQRSADCGELTLIQPDPYQATLLHDSALKLPARSLRDRRRQIIEPVLDDKSLRFLGLRPMELISTYFKNGLPCCENTILTLFRLYWTYGQVWNALAPSYHLRGVPTKPRKIGSKKQGRPRNGVGDERHEGINIDAVAATKLDAGLALLKGERSYEKVLDQIINRHFSLTQIVDGLPTVVPLPQSQLPTVAQLKYHIKKKASLSEIIIKREGQDAFVHERRDRTGSARQKAKGPASIYQIDSTLADIYLRSIRNPRALVGRPVVYLVVDVYSGMIVGFHVSLSPPNYESARCALMNALTDKVAYCAEYGIHIKQDEWPARHVPYELMTDRGSDFTSQVLSDASGAVDIKISFAARRRPDWKPMVEGSFEWLDAGMTRWEPGSIHGRPPGSPSYPNDAIHTIRSFRKMLIYAILGFNAHRIKNVPLGFEVPQDHYPKRSEIYLRGMELEGAPRLPDLELVETAFLPRAVGKLSDIGLMVNGMAYRAALGFDRDWYVRQGGRTWAEINVHYHPYKADDVRLLIGSDPRAQRFTLTPSYQNFREWSVEECWDFQALRKSANRRKANADNFETAKRNAGQSRVRKQAAHERRNAGGKTTSDGMKQARKEENKHDVRKSPCQKATEQPREAEQGTTTQSPTQFQYIQSRSRIGILKQKKP